jgi:hypothetical protein
MRTNVRNLLLSLVCSLGLNVVLFSVALAKSPFEDSLFLDAVGVIDSPVSTVVRFIIPGHGSFPQVVLIIVLSVFWYGAIFWIIFSVWSWLRGKRRPTSILL